MDQLDKKFSVYLKEAELSLVNQVIQELGDKITKPGDLVVFLADFYLNNKDTSGREEYEKLQIELQTLQQQHVELKNEFTKYHNANIEMGTHISVTTHKLEVAERKVQELTELQDISNKAIEAGKRVVQDLSKQVFQPGDNEYIVAIVPDLVAACRKARPFLREKGAITEGSVNEMINLALKEYFRIYLPSVL